MKAIKILIVFAFSIGVITLNSCKKKEVAPAPSISASIDGTATSFNTGAKAIKATLQGVTSTTIQGQSANGTIISITLSGNITAGATYTADVNSSSNEPLLFLTSSTFQYANDDASSNLVSVTVNSVSSTSITGTFKGNLTELSNDNSSASTTKVVSNGMFSVSF